ncbi:copper resistance protein B [Pseudoxanthomonas kalamensis]|uniref:copper resistance protein B n=1 Tax=Pseudoxanthomonas kalamensis TaxID=289483 RepID=UPI001FE5AD4B|nr:copper resistance protein B [Pseudoxanthomonas kalamensis]
MLAPALLCWMASAAAQPQDHASHHGHGTEPSAAAESAPESLRPQSVTAPTPEQLAAAFPDLGGMDMREHMQEDPLIGVLRIDELETGQAHGLDWNLRASLGHDLDKLLLRSEGSQPQHGDRHGDVELLWSHATGPWWDHVVGLRSDFGEGPSRQWLAVGVSGLAPYWFEVEATAYVGESGRLAARLEAEYELLLSNRLILQPKLEANLYGKDDPANRIGHGLSDAELSLRLRYEFSPRFAPYAGYAWERRFGRSADFAEAEDGTASEHGWVAGIRFWF